MLVNTVGSLQMRRFEILKSRAGAPPSGKNIPTVAARDQICYPRFPYGQFRNSKRRPVVKCDTTA